MSRHPFSINSLFNKLFVGYIFGLNLIGLKRFCFVLLFVFFKIGSLKGNQWSKGLYSMPFLAHSYNSLSQTEQKTNERSNHPTFIVKSWDQIIMCRVSARGQI